MLGAQPIKLLNLSRHVQRHLIEIQRLDGSIFTDILKYILQLINFVSGFLVNLHNTLVKIFLYNFLAEKIFLFYVEFMLYNSCQSQFLCSSWTICNGKVCSCWRNPVSFNRRCWYHDNSYDSRAVQTRYSSCLMLKINPFVFVFI